MFRIKQNNKVLGEVENLSWFFENSNFKEDEVKIYISSKKAEQILNNEVEKILDEYDYDSIGDVKVYADDENSPFYEEAKKILNWYKQVWDWFYEFIDNKEEINYDEFLKKYPKFEE